MPWEFFDDGNFPRWHYHSMRGLGKRSRIPIKPLELVTRKDWGACFEADMEPLFHPVKNVRHLGTSTDKCSTKEECIQLVHSIQESQMKEGLPDIQWNFIVGGDNNVYEGRGWKVDASRPDGLEGLVGNCMDIAYIGEYKEQSDIPESMWEKGKEIIEYGVRKRYIDCCHRNYAYGDPIPTSH